MTISQENHAAYPLDWPLSKPRTSAVNRKQSRFKQSFADARRCLIEELDRFGARDAILSTNIVLRLDGLPRANEPEPVDTGVAVWFRRRGKPYVFACDTYRKTWENVYALARTLEALRQIERDGGPSLMEQAFTGFAALPPAILTPPPKLWWQVLGVDSDASELTIYEAHEKLIREVHPDVGGDNAQAAEINAARDTGIKWRQLETV